MPPAASPAAQQGGSSPLPEQVAKATGVSRPQIPVQGCGGSPGGARPSPRVADSARPPPSQGAEKASALLTFARAGRREAS